MILRVLDVESTGIPSATETHALVEVGYTDIRREGDRWVVGSKTRSMLCNPGRPIPPEASAVHHITDDMVADAPSPDRACAMLADGSDSLLGYASHKNDFDMQFFGGGGKPWLCTHKCGLRIWEDAPAHGNQVLRYWLKLDDEEDFEPALAFPPHRAGPDSYVTAHLMARILDTNDFDTLVRWSKGPALLITCYLNKHRGKRWSQVARDDPSYLDWIVNKSDMDDRDIRATAKYWLRKVAEERAPAADGEVSG